MASNKQGFSGGWKRCVGKGTSISSGAPSYINLKGDVCTHRHMCTHTFTHMHSFTDTYGSHLRDRVRVGFTGARMLVVPRQPPGTVTTLAKFSGHGLALNLIGLETGFCPQRKRTQET